MTTSYTVQSWPSVPGETEDRYKALYNIANGNYEYRSNGKIAVGGTSSVTIKAPSGWKYDEANDRPGRVDDYKTAARAAGLLYDPKGTQ